MTQAVLELAMWWVRDDDLELLILLGLPRAGVTGCTTPHYFFKTSSCYVAQAILVLAV